MSRAVLKWNVPVDDQWHPIGPGRVVLTECQHGADVVQVWTEEELPVQGAFGDHPRCARVFGTGHTLPDRGEHLGSCLAMGGSLCWHVYADSDR